MALAIELNANVGRKKYLLLSVVHLFFAEFIDFVGCVQVVSDINPIRDSKAADKKKKAQ
jgi:hypothetical protein